MTVPYWNFVLNFYFSKKSDKINFKPVKTWQIEVDKKWFKVRDKSSGRL